MSLFKPESMAVAEIIEKLQEAVDLGDSPHRGPFGTFIRKEYLVEAIEMLKTHPEAQPNEPLSLEELRGMRSAPVWVQSKGLKGLGIWVIIKEVDPDLGLVSFNNGILIKLEDWKDEISFYIRPPKEDCHGLS